MRNRRKSYPNETVTLEKFVPGGSVIGTLADGRRVFVWGGLPGETVEVEITKSKKSYAEGNVVKNTTSSPHRIEPRDECFMATSPWQIMDYDYELRMKAELVRESFRQEKIELPTSTENYIRTDGREFDYRNKMEYALYWDNEAEKIRLAFHRRHSHTKIPITHSSIEMPEIFAAASAKINELNARGEAARKYSSLIVRANRAGETRVVLREMGKPNPPTENLRDTILGHEYSYSPLGFFQVNLPVYEMALRDIMNWIPEQVRNDKVVDLYAGVGTIGLSVASGRDLTLVEVDGNAYAELEKNVTATVASNLGTDFSAARSRPLGQDAAAKKCSEAATCPAINAVLAKSEDALEYISSGAAVIVDPPRAGLDPKVVARINEVRPPRVIYLSCNPATQARDVALISKNYKIAFASGYNFFPRTPHIENLVVLDKID